MSGQGEALCYTLERKKVKNLNLRVRGDGSIYVSAPARVPLGQVDAFVLREEAFICRARKRLAAAPPKPAPTRQFADGEVFPLLGMPRLIAVEQSSQEGAFLDGEILHLRVKEPDSAENRKKVMDRYLKESCQAVFQKLLERIFPIFARMGVSMPSLKVREMKTRWGTCHTVKKVITLNSRLIEAPYECIEYVAMHEYCHFIHPNHSKAFHGLMTALIPDWKARKTLLNRSVTI